MMYCTSKKLKLTSHPLLAFLPSYVVAVPLIWSKPSISGPGACARGGQSSVVCGNFLVVFGGQYYGGTKGRGESDHYINYYIYYIAIHLWLTRYLKRP